MANKNYPNDRSFRAYLHQKLQDPEFARVYEELRPEYDAIIKLIQLRKDKGLSQRQLAERVGAKQPSIARLESRKKTRNLNLLERIASVHGYRVTVGIENRTSRAGAAP